MLNYEVPRDSSLEQLHERGEIGVAIWMKKKKKLLQRLLCVANQMCVNFQSCWFGKEANWVIFQEPICLSINTRESPFLSHPDWCPSGPNDKQIVNIISCDRRRFEKCFACPILVTACSFTNDFHHVLRGASWPWTQLGQIGVILNCNLKCCPFPFLFFLTKSKYHQLCKII